MHMMLRDRIVANFDRYDSIAILIFTHELFEFCSIVAIYYLYRAQKLDRFYYIEMFGLDDEFASQKTNYIEVYTGD